MNNMEKLEMWKATVQDKNAAGAEKVTAQVQLAIRNHVDGALLSDYAKAVAKFNTARRADSVADVVAMSGSLWKSVADGVMYYRATVSDKGDVKLSQKDIRPSDFVCMKATASSKKIELSADVMALVKVCSANVVDAKGKEIAARADVSDEIRLVKRYSSVDVKLECFYTHEVDDGKQKRISEATSGKNLEKQLQYITDLLMGNDYAKIRGVDVKYLMDVFCRATGGKWKNGNEVKFLDFYVEAVRYARDKHQYSVKSALDEHKKPKEE